jgi:predicted methyltransferase
MKHFLRSSAITISTLLSCTLYLSNSYADNHGAHASSSLDSILAAQPDEHKARYDARHPKETLEFFQVTAGDTVLEALPGGGWYTQILVPLLGEKGTLIGVGYDPMMGQDPQNPDEEAMARRNEWPKTWPAKIAEWDIDSGANVIAYNFGSVSETLDDSVDKVLFFRAMHGLTRFENDGGYLSNALADSFRVLKPGGILGVVQHAAREDRSDEWANGNSGYLKQSFVVEMATKAGFELVDTSDINANELDQAKDGDIVWRLPPSLSTSNEDPELAAQMKAIGESNRMTLKFRKPY